MRVRDWLKLIVAERQFDAGSFELPRLGEPVRASSRTPLGLNSVLNRIGRLALHRDADAEEPSAEDWATVELPIVVRVTEPT